MTGLECRRKNIPRVFFFFLFFFLTGFALIKPKAVTVWLCCVCISLPAGVPFSSCDLRFKGDTITSSIANAPSSITGYHSGTSLSTRGNCRSWLLPKIACSAVPGSLPDSPRQLCSRKEFIPGPSLGYAYIQYKLSSVFGIMT